MSVTIQDLNGDSIAELIVTNQGSNDVSLLFGTWDDSGNGVGTTGPRLKSGGSGPIAAQAVFPAGGGLSQLVMTNGQSGTLTVLPGGAVLDAMRAQNYRRYAREAETQAITRADDVAVCRAGRTA